MDDSLKDVIRPHRYIQVPFHAFLITWKYNSFERNYSLILTEWEMLVM